MMQLTRTTDRAQELILGRGTVARDFWGSHPSKRQDCLTVTRALTLMGVASGELTGAHVGYLMGFRHWQVALDYRLAGDGAWHI